MTGRRGWRRWGPWLGIAAILLVGGALRLCYFFNGDPFVDEWATMIAARSTWERGIPILPSGVLYGYGLLFYYLEALFLGLFGWTAVVAQIPSLIAGLAAIPLAYVVGRRLFSAPDGDRAMPWRGEVVGLLAAALVALDPDAILWSGRARSYSLQQLLILLATLWLYRRHYIAFALAYSAAVLVHTEAALLLPGFAVGLWLLEGRAVLGRARAWLAMGIASAAVAGQWLIHRFITTGNARQFLVVDDPRPGLHVSLDLVAGFKPLLPYFTEPYRLGVTAFALAGLLLALTAWRRREQSGGYRLLYPLFLVTLIALATLVGQSWKNPRYLLMTLPLFFLLAAAAATDVLAGLAGRLRGPAWPRAALGVGLAALLLVPLLPAALKAARQMEEGYGPTLAYVREHLRPDDQVAGCAVPAMQVELGVVDYFAMQIRHEEFIMQKDGVWRDRWVGAPLMDRVEQLEAVLGEPGRLWFLVDEYRLRSRYTSEFVQVLWDRMDPVYRSQNAIAFLERPALEPAYHRDVRADWESGIGLVGYDLSPATPSPGGMLAVTLYWSARDQVDAPFTAFVHLLDPAGRRIAQDDGPPLGGLLPTSSWVPGERLRDERTLALPPDAISGRYRLEVGWYDPGTLERLPLSTGGDSFYLATLPLGRLEVEEPGVRIDADLDAHVRLVGYDVWRLSGGQWLPLGEGERLSVGDHLKVNLVWQALLEMEPSYTVFVHLEGPGGVVWAQHDGLPVSGSYPTSHWRPGEWVSDEHELVVREGALGVARMEVGMYRLETMERLGEAVTLGEVEVVP